MVWSYGRRRPGCLSRETKTITSVLSIPAMKITPNNQALIKVLIAYYVLHQVCSFHENPPCENFKLCLGISGDMFEIESAVEYKNQADAIWLVAIAITSCVFFSAFAFISRKVSAARFT